MFNVNNLYSHIKKLYKLVSGSLLFAPSVVLIAILIITIWPWQNARQNLQSGINRSIEGQSQAVENTIVGRFDDYNSTVLSGVGLLQASPSTGREQWQTFFTATSVSANRADIRGIGYAAVFPQSDINTVISALQAQGQTNFVVHPLDPERSLYSALFYVYPETKNNQAALGYDMLSQPTRRAAMERARDTSQPALTGKVRLIQDKPSDDSQGFLLFSPYYQPGSDISTVASRQQNLRGYVYGSFAAKTLFERIIEQPSQQQHFSLSLYDTPISATNLLYQTKNSQLIKKAGHTKTVIKPLKIFGTTWQMAFTFDKGYQSSRSEQNAPIYILIVGVVTSMLVLLAILSIFKSRARELQQQKEREVKLAKDELLSLASHQMRTPATGVKQYLGMVLQGFAGRIDKQQQALLEKAYTSNERQLQVINQILHLAKLEEGRMVLAKHDTNMNELISDIAEEQQTELKNHGHNLRLKLPRQTIRMRIDSHMLRMAIENVLSNAIKYTLQPGTIGVTLSQSTTIVTITITDSGIGIAPQQLDKIFDQFTRLYNEQAGGVSGTGVGLYLANHLVRLHKGTLKVESEPGRGSTFTICLPRPRNPSKAKKQ